MKTLFHNIAALGLSALVLFSTFSFTVDLHFCGNHLVDIALNEEADGCWMELPGIGASEDSEAGTEDCLPTAMKCCRDVLLAINGQEDLQPSDCQAATHALYTTSGISQPVFRTYPAMGLDKITFRDYLPPPLIRDIPVMHQTFLI